MSNVQVKIEPVQKSHIKSQVVDDVLEILIKNGELPPSAAQDPATPTTPNRQLQQNLVFTAPADSPTQSLVFTAASPMSPISPIPMEVSHSGCSSPSTPAPPPPPPPLPLTTFSIQLPSALQQLEQQEEISSFSTDLLTSEAELDTAMLLSPQSTQQSSPDPQPPQEVTSSDNANLDLKVHLLRDKIDRGSNKNYKYNDFFRSWDWTWKHWIRWTFANWTATCRWIWTIPIGWTH